MSDLLIRGADLIGRGRSDLLIRNGRFVDPTDAGADLDRLDADGLIALPGLVDLHTHLREPGREDGGVRHAGRGTRRLHRGAGDGQHDSGHRYR